MHILKRSLLLFGVTALALTACKDEAAAPNTIAVTNITVSPPSVSISAGQSVTVSATVVTNGGTGTIDLGVNWTSSNTSIATVNAAGSVTGVAPGTTTVTATSKANAAIAQSISVTVTGPAQQPNALLTYSLTPGAVSIVSGQTATTVGIETHSTNATVTYVNVSSNTARCTVTGTGASPTITTVIAGGVGNCVITSTASGSGTGLVSNSIVQTVAVTVTASPTALVSLTVAPTSISIVAGQSASTQTIASLSAGATVSYVNTSSDLTRCADPADVANPTITTIVAGGAGSCVITITATGTGAGLTTNVIAQTIAVTVTAQGNALLSLAVSPTSVSIVSGFTANTSTITSVATGATVAYVNTSSDVTRCADPADTPNPVITTLAAAGPGNCVITIQATGSGTGLATNAIAQAIAVTVTAQPVALTSLTVSPTSVNMVPNGPTQVITTLTQQAVGATVTFANSTSNASVATVTTTGANPTITPTGNGVAQITIVATGTGAGLATNSISAIVQVNVQAASVSISELTTCTGGPPCIVGPVFLAGVMGQIEATVNISSGFQQIASVAVFIGPPVAGVCPAVGAPGSAYVEAARQIFGVNGAPTAPVTLSIKTANFNPTTFVPDFLNGSECIQARLFPAGVGQPNPDASNTIQFTLTNPDVVYYLTVAEQAAGTTGSAIGLNHTSGISAVGAGGFTWWKGGFTFRAHPVLYSGTANVVSVNYTSTACAAPAVGGAPTFVATFSCAGFQGAQNIASPVTITYVPTYTLTVSPVAFMTAASAGYVPGSPVFAANATREDNVGPVTSTPVFVNTGAGGWHGNGSAGVSLPIAPSFQLVAIAPVAGTTYTVAAADGGVGTLASLPTINQVNICGLPNCAVATGPHLNITAANQLPETITPVPYQLQGTAVNDILGNVGTASGLTAAFGVDLIVLDARYADGAYTTVPGAVASAARYLGANGSAATGTGIFTTLGAAVAPAALWGPIDGVTESIFVEAIDTRSGLNNPAAFFQSVRRLWAGGNVNCYVSAAGGDPLNVIQPNSYVRNPAPTGVMDCLAGAGVAGPGYYTWTGHVADRANNRKKPVRGAGAGTVMDSVWIAIDGALPNITGVGFQTAPLPLTYAGAASATYTFSANDDLELKDAQITLNYLGVPGPCGAPCASGSGVPFLGPFGGVVFPYSSAAYTSAAFGTPFDGLTVTNVINSGALTLGYYIVRYDIATVAAFVPGAAPTGNVAAFTSGEIQSGVIANIRDVAYQQAAVALAAPILNTQITDRPSAGTPPVGALAYTTMIDFRIVGVAAGVVTVRDAAASSTAVPFCDRVDIYEARNAGGVAPAGANAMTANDASLGDAAGDGLIWRATIAGAPVLTDNGFQRFYTYTSAAGQLTPPLGTPAGTGLYVAACVKSGSALLSPIF